MDDGSTDDTKTAAEQAGARVVSHATNQGITAARNSALAAARFPWIAWLDSDDVWLPDHLARVWQLKDGDHVLVADSAAGRETGRMYGNPYPRTLELRSPRRVIWPVNPVVTSSALMQTSVAERLGGFRAVGLAEDLDLWIRMIAVGSGRVHSAVGSLRAEHSGQASNNLALVYSSVHDIVARFAGEPWYDEGLLRAVDACHKWYAFQDAVRSRSLSEAWTSGRLLEGSATQVSTAIRLTAWGIASRRWARRR